MNKKSITDSHATLGALLRRPYETMSEWVYGQLSESGLEVRPAFSAVLRNLSPEGGRVSDLALKAGMAKQSMGYLVDQMASAGLVELSPDPQDGRAKIVLLTAKGTAAVLQAVDLSARYESFLAELIGEPEMEQLRDLLTQLHTALGEKPTP